MNDLNVPCPACHRPIPVTTTFTKDDTRTSPGTAYVHVQVDKHTLGLLVRDHINRHHQEGNR